jgi:hypothetical protein
MTFILIILDIILAIILLAGVKNKLMKPTCNQWICGGCRKKFDPKELFWARAGSLPVCPYCKHQGFGS